MPQTDQLTETVRKALHRAYSLGQTYWQQADSVCYAANKRSEETAAKFEQLSAETLASLAVPLVAEAPREPTGEMRWAGAEAAKVQLQWKPDELDWQKAAGEIYKAMRAAAPVASLAPMPEEPSVVELTQMLDRFAHACHERGSAIQRHDSERAGQWLTIIENVRAALLSHLRTAPLTLSDEQTREPPVLVLGALEVLKRTDYRIGDRVLVENFLRSMGERGMWVIENPIPALLASVAPQPEQPNTEQPHLADNGRTPVQGLDSAGVALPNDAARLDWLAHREHSFEFCVPGDHVAKKAWLLSVETGQIDRQGKFYDEFDGDTLREAIDAAMKVNAGAQEPRVGWCEHCGEGVTTFCRGTLTPCPKGLPKTIAAGESPSDGETDRAAMTSTTAKE